MYHVSMSRSNHVGRCHVVSLQPHLFSLSCEEKENSRAVGHKCVQTTQKEKQQQLKYKKTLSSYSA